MFLYFVRNCFSILRRENNELNFYWAQFAAKRLQIYYDQRLSRQRGVFSLVSSTIDLQLIKMWLSNVYDVCRYFHLSKSHVIQKHSMKLDIKHCTVRYTLFFLNKNIVFPAEAEYSYFSDNFSLKIFLWIFLDYSIWHFCFRMYFVSGWCFT